jgi:5'-3' exonuclease
MLCDLLVDGNYLLSRMVFTLHKNNLLFGALYKSLETSINNYRKWYPFANIYLVSDSKEKSWRKKIYTNYKANRKKDNDIDWEFVFQVYGEFKSTLKNKGVQVLEAPNIEGDDWISFLIEKSNSEKRSTIIVSNDYDIKQLIKFDINGPYINLMSNEMHSKQKLFLPKNYRFFLSEINKKNNDDIFNLNDNQDFINLFINFTEKCEVYEIDPMEALIIKLISGDTSDNILSAWSVVKNGKKRGIAEKGAKSIFDEYLLNFGEPTLEDPDLTENIADLICEKKKLSKASIIDIKINIENNMKLILLNTQYFPSEIVSKMDSVYNSIKNI